MDVEIRHLRAFIDVVHSGSITAAARRLRVGQPALSRTLSQLESRLRVRLVDRGPRGLTLTPAGRRFLPEAEAAVAQFEEAVASVEADEVHATLGFSWLLPPWLPADLESWLQDRRPALTLRVRRAERPLDELRAGRVHAAVHRLPVVAHDLVAVPVGRESRVLTIARAPGRHLSPDQGRARGHGVVGHPRTGPPPGCGGARRVGGAALAAPTLRADPGVNSLGPQPVWLVPGSGSVRPLAPPTTSASSYHSISTSIFTFVPVLF